MGPRERMADDFRTHHGLLRACPHPCPQECVRDIPPSECFMQLMSHPRPPQNEKSQWFLKRIAVLNKSMLQDIPVNMDILGAFSSSGVSYDLLTSHCEEMFAKAAEQEIQAEHITEASTAEQRKKELIQQHKRNMKSGSLRNDVVNPNTLWDIVEYGIINPESSVQCAFELMEQLKKQTRYPVLLLIDDWSECFAKSGFLSSKYQYTPYGGYIPSNHLSMPHLHHRWDGVEFRRGVKIVATSRSREVMEDPKDLGIRASEIIQVSPFSGREFSHFVAYGSHHKLFHNFPKNRVGYFHMMSGGNGFHARRLLATLY
eukprot:GHVN01036356.1.p1 GENE.GHVN01036356.1~~GHVN01036356.1.p1  ORF type:complete len:315 (+),score=20.16 GHVN01036356.1:616-1560(+)